MDFPPYIVRPRDAHTKLHVSAIERASKEKEFQEIFSFPFLYIWNLTNSFFVLFFVFLPFRDNLMCGIPSNRN